MDDYERRLQATAKLLEDSTRLFAKQMVRSESVHRAMMWKIIGVAGGCIALLLVAAIWLSSHYLSVIEDNKVSADLLRAYNTSDVMLCNDGKLCANVNPKGQRFGDHGQYVLVNPR